MGTLLVNGSGSLDMTPAVQPAIQAERAAIPVDVALDVVRRGADYVCHVYNEVTQALIVVTPPVSDVHAAIELAREMFRIGKLILTPDMDANWGHA